MTEEFAALYTNPKGQPVTHSSYSGRSDFKKCPRYFQLTRIQGWMDKEKRAAPLFGKCIEAGVEYFEGLERTDGTAVTKFTELWFAVTELADFKSLIYSEKEKDWESLNRAGREMMALYEIVCTWLPISTRPKTTFQQVLRKKVFPGTKYDKLENKAIFDMISYPAWNHPTLPKISVEESTADMQRTSTPWRTLIIDIKTSGVHLDTEFVRLDPQLAEYAWMARIPDIAFLWFVKSGHEIKKGSRVCALSTHSASGAVPGFDYLVLVNDKEKGLVYIGNHAAMESYEKAVQGARGKARDTIEEAHLMAARTAGTVFAVEPSTLTRQRIQFAAARLTQADMDEIGRDVAQTTVEMIRAKTDEYYPKLAGVRFPNQKCQFCAMRHICLGDSDARDANLTRKGDEWLEETLENGNE